MAPIIEQLPNEPVFHNLLLCSNKNPQRVVVYDAKEPVDATFSQLLVDVLYMRRHILSTLPTSMFNSQGQVDSKRPYMIVLAPGNYEFIVASLAILACGAALAPIASTLTPEETYHLVEMCDASCILVSARYQRQRTELEDYYAAHTKSDKPLAMIEIATRTVQTTLGGQAHIDTTIQLDPKGPGALIFTSGTTGPPKGVVHPRSVWYTNMPTFDRDQVALSYRAPNWITPVLFLIHQVPRGMSIQVVEDNPRAIWEAFSKGQVTHFIGLPLAFATLVKYFHRHLGGLPDEKLRPYIEGARCLQVVSVVGGIAWPSVLGFWKQLLGRPLGNFYGSTEVGVAITRTADCDPDLERCIGKPLPGVQVKLSEGGHGEVLLKTDTMFTHYLGNPALTRAALDEEGYYKSGDLGHRVGDQYVIDGRASTDFIRFHCLHVPVNEVEARLVELQYIQEAYVVAVPFNYETNIGVLIRPTSPETCVSLRRIRFDLQHKVQRYQLPTLMRILRDDEEIPVTTSGKPLRKGIQEQYFSLPEEAPLPTGVEHCDCYGSEEAPRKAWDWAGMA